MLVGGYIRVYLVVYHPEIIGGFGLEEKSQIMKVPPIIDPLIDPIIEHNTITPARAQIWMTLDPW